MGGEALASVLCEEVRAMAPPKLEAAAKGRIAHCFMTSKGGAEENLSRSRKRMRGDRDPAGASNAFVFPSFQSSTGRPT